MPEVRGAEAGKAVFNLQRFRRIRRWDILLAGKL
jgi:hypothetical protein